MRRQRQFKLNVDLDHDAGGAHDVRVEYDDRGHDVQGAAGEGKGGHRLGVGSCDRAVGPGLAAWTDGVMTVGRGRVGQWAGLHFCAGKARLTRGSRLHGCEADERR